MRQVSLRHRFCGEQSDVLTQSFINLMVCVAEARHSEEHWIKLVLAVLCYKRRVAINNIICPRQIVPMVA